MGFSDKDKIIMPFARPLYVMTKPVGAACNLACEYCYYLEKAGLYKSTSAHHSPSLMSEETLEAFTRDYIRSQTTLEVMFTWHGGEPLLRPISFYEKALELQRKYAGNRRIANCIQTNGTLLTKEWCEFLRRNDFLVGISIDGEGAIHDTYRRHHNSDPSFAEVLRGINMLNHYGVEWNAMAVVNNLNVERPLEFYRFFRDELRCQFLQFTPIVERIKSSPDEKSPLRLLAGREQGGELAPFSVTPEQWGEFLCTIFKEWVQNDVGKMFIQLFDSTLANWVGVEPGVCTLGTHCGHAAVMEYNGDVYACDHFVFPEYLLGNIHEKSLSEMMYGQMQRDFGEAKLRTLPQQCRRCKYEFACHGECPRNRFATTRDGEQGLNYLCEGYYRYFDFVAPYMEFMRRELSQQRPPSNVMAWARRVLG